MMKCTRYLFWIANSIAYYCLTIANPIQAQIVPDKTLGAESSVAAPSSNRVDVIEGGATRGTNLFHSFEQFSVLEGHTAFFNNATSIQNIISRVTGSSTSKIDGLITANGTANLFLLNPKGIDFGPKAQLNIGGSFLASTASSLNFADGTQFSAIAPQTTPLLTVSVPIGLQYTGNAGSITNRSRAANNEGIGLQVKPGKTLALVGGEVNLEGGGLQALGGRIELGGVTGTGTVGLDVGNQDSNNLSLHFPADIPRADVAIADEAQVRVAAGGGGSVAVNANNLKVLNNSLVQAGIKDLGSQEAKAGDININTTGAVTVAASNIENTVKSNTWGNAGDISIRAQSVSVTNGSRLNTNTKGRGNAGSIKITAQDAVRFEGVKFNANQKITSASGASTVVEEKAEGNGGNISINAGSVFVTNGGKLNTSMEGNGGNAGNLTINAQGAVKFEGVAEEVGNDGKPQLVSSIALSRLASQKVGQDGKPHSGGNIYIDAGSIEISNGAFLIAETIGKGDAGNITLRARDNVSIDGGKEIKSGDPGTAIIASNGRNTEKEKGLGRVGEGEPGTITIEAGSVSVTNGGRIITDINGQRTNSRKEAGNITIKARGAVSFSGVKNTRQSAATTEVKINFFKTEDTKEDTFRRAEGNGGDISIDAESVYVTDGALLNARTNGQGNSGNIQINAVNLNISGMHSRSRRSSELSTTTGETAIGEGGKITVNTNHLTVENEAIISARTFNANQGGNITVNTNTFSLTTGGRVRTTATTNPSDPRRSETAMSRAKQKSSGNAGRISLNIRDMGILSDPKSGLLADTDPGTSGRGGNLTIKAESAHLTIQNGAQVTASSQGSGDAGNITEITARSLTLDNGLITTTSRSGQGGNIQKLQVQDLLLLRNRSQISTTAGTDQRGRGNGGNITINAPFIVAVPSENSDISANAFAGSGGNVTIASQGIFGIRQQKQNTPQSDITASSQFGISGVINIITPGIDPSQGLVALPTELVDASGLIAQGCSRGGRHLSGQFVMTGRGGLPPNPQEVLRSDVVPLADLGRSSLTAAQSVPEPEQNDSTTAVATPPADASPVPLVEAQGWAIAANGDVMLVAQAPTGTPHSSWKPPASCHTP